MKDKASDKALLQGKHKEDLYQIDLNHQQRANVKQHPHQVLTCSFSNEPEKVKSMKIWHNHLGHHSFKVLAKVLNSCNQTLAVNENDIFCDACQLSKSHLLPFAHSSSHTTQSLELVHTDIWGPSPILSTSGFKYYALFLDDYSKFI